MIAGSSPITRLALADEAATAALGARLAGRARAGDVYALGGDLGTGKTVLARGFIRALSGADTEVPSPTFTLVQSYETGGFEIHHFDLYRLERAEDAYELGVEDAFADGVSLIEWPEKLGALLPKSHLRISLSADGRGRAANLDGPDEWAARLEGLHG